jgi:hypothetical protein
MTDEEIEVALRQIGGNQIVTAWRQRYEETQVAGLPTAYADTLSGGYAFLLGGIATVVDLFLDHQFRAEMAEKHRLLSAEEQAKLEEAVTQRMKDAGVYPDNLSNQPKMAMDWYQRLNDELGLTSPYRLRPANHRILNHTDTRTVIEMLMKGEAGFGNLREKLYPGMSETLARELYNLHLAADRGTPASVPLRIMSWLWEQCIRSQAPDKVGGPNVVFSFLQRFGPNLDWAGWINKFTGQDGLIPANASIGEAMLKLYDSGVLNQRVFWTSDLGAAVGGMKRRALIAATIELGVEAYAVFEGVRLGFVKWHDGPQQLAASYKEWRDQPKYLNMRIMAQTLACAGPASRAVFTGDVLGLNLPSMAMTVRHIWMGSGVTRRHTDRLVMFSKNDSAEMIRNFRMETGIHIPPALSVIQGGVMAQSLDQRLHAAGCQSTRVRVLASRYASEVEPVIMRIEKLSARAQGNNAMEAAFDAICESWYLSDEKDDAAAINLLKTDVVRLEKAFNQ